MAGSIEALKRRLQTVGFTLEELMEGEHEFEPGFGPPGRHPMRFKVKWGPDDLLSYLTPGDPGFLRQRMEGSVTVGGLCDEAPCFGTLELRYLTDHSIRYEFSFEANDKAYRYTGEKVNIRAWNLPFSHTTCFGRIVEADSGKLVSTSITYFKLKNAASFLTSLRLRAA